MSNSGDDQHWDDSKSTPEVPPAKTETGVNKCRICDTKVCPDRQAKFDRGIARGVKVQIQLEFLKKELDGPNRQDLLMKFKLHLVGVADEFLKYPPEVLEAILAAMKEEDVCKAVNPVIAKMVVSMSEILVPLIKQAHPALGKVNIEFHETRPKDPVNALDGILKTLGLN